MVVCTNIVLALPPLAPSPVASDTRIVQECAQLVGAHESQLTLQQCSMNIT